MVRICLIFTPMQPGGLYESVMFNQAHIAIAYQKHNQTMWFDRVPCAGETVIFLAPQGSSTVLFKVEDVQHFPHEGGSMAVALGTDHSFIVLRPLLAV
jgi:hypothetical protein